MQGHKDLLRCSHWWGSSGSTVWMSCYAKKPLLYLLKAIMKLPKVQDTSNRPRAHFTCKCKNRKSYSWRQRVRQKSKCQTLANAAKSSVCLAPCTQTEAFLAQEIISPVETTWNCFKVRKKNPFCNTAILSRKLLWYGSWITWKMGNSPQTVRGLPRFYHNTLVFAKWRRKRASKNSSSSQDETNYTHFVPGQQLLVSPKFWLGVGGVTASYRHFSSSKFLARRALWQVIPGLTLSGFWHAIHQSINPSSVMLLSWWTNTLKLWASLLAVCIFFLYQCHGQTRCHSLG